MSLLGLRPYQIKAVEAATAPNEAVWRRLVVMATGGGKTLVFSEIINRALKPGQRALVLAHREELLDQAKAEIEAYVPGVQVEIERAEHRASREGSDENARSVVVGSVASMRGNRLKTWDRDTFDLVIIDEAHHGAAASYRAIVEHFGCMNEARRTPLIGVTATPVRSDKVGLDVIFQEISSDHNIRELIEQGYLCKICAISVETDTDIRDVGMFGGDFIGSQLEDAVDTDERNALIVASWQKYSSDRPTIVYAAGVDHAQDIAAMFRNAIGVTAECVWGGMGTEARKRTLARYASGETQVLTNYAVLSEGFNEPKTSCIILARPTTSTLIVAQAIGRGTRNHSRKSNCLVIDVIDVIGNKKIVSAASLAGMPPKFNARGEDAYAVGDEWKELYKLNPSIARGSLDVETVRKWIKILKERIISRQLSILESKSYEHNGHLTFERGWEGKPYCSPFNWKKINNDEVYMLILGKTHYMVSGRDRLWTLGRSVEDGPTKFLTCADHWSSRWAESGIFETPGQAIQVCDENLSKICRWENGRAAEASCIEGTPSLQTAI
jgi:superfamily II DNA or RNA helicase